VRPTPQSKKKRLVNQYIYKAFLFCRTLKLIYHGLPALTKIPYTKGVKKPKDIEEADREGALSYLKGANSFFRLSSIARSVTFLFKI